MKLYIRRLIYLVWVLCLATLHPAHASDKPIVVRLVIHDTIQPVTANYLKRGLQEADRIHATLVLISLGTPGGLLESTRLMVQAIEISPIPVVVYVSPAGSRAGSAGFFLLEAADVAAMAPGTNAGAAHPIVEGRQMDPILKEKLENDAAAFIRSCVAPRGRNVEAAEGVVRNSKSYSDTEAITLHLIDVIAPDEGSLLTSLDGHEIQRLNGTRSIVNLGSASFVTIMPSLRDRLLSKLANPDLAVLLIVLGGFLVYLEFNVPGTIVPGTLGTLFILLGFFGLNLLPIRFTAILLITAAVVMIILEAKFASHGVLGLAGIGALVFGLATLVDGPIAEQKVHLGVALGAGIGFGIVTLGLAWIAVRARRNKILLGPTALLGQLATVQTPLSPDGQVEIRGELWQARLGNGGGLPAGASVRVKDIDNLLLIVESAQNRD
jgi:membrane-bound serine protease (ClpP class)